MKTILILFHLFVYDQPYDLTVVKMTPEVREFCTMDENCMDINTFESRAWPILTRTFKSGAKTVFLNESQYIEITPSGERFYCQQGAPKSKCVLEKDLHEACHEGEIWSDKYEQCVPAFKCKTDDDCGPYAECMEEGFCIPV